jgi:NADH:quinone reductase (non-electrogenic)
MTETAPDKSVVIIGAGFAGLQAAKALSRAAPSAKILLIDRHNYHTFSPLLYQVATAAIEPEEIAFPVRAIVRNRPNLRFLLAGVQSIDIRSRLVVTSGGSVPYDYLIVAAGSETNFYGIAGAEASAYEVKDLPEAMALRNRILSTFERAADEPKGDLRQKLMTIVIVGGGPTGVELAGAIAELSRAMIRRDFPTLDDSEVRVIQIEAGKRLLSAFRPRLGQAALDFMRDRRVEVLLDTTVESIDESSVRLAGGRSIESALIIWAAGVRASPLSSSLSKSPASSNRRTVLPTLQLPDHREVYVVGDMAELRTGRSPLPMLAPPAMQEGRHAALNIARQMRGEQPIGFHYRDRGTMATLGRSHAVAQIGPVSLTGFLAWVAWLALHLVELIGFRNRALVLINWIWTYVFFEGGTRAILPPEQQPRHED